MSRRSDNQSLAAPPDRLREGKNCFPLALVGQQLLIANGTATGPLGSNSVIKPARVRKRLSSSSLG